MSAHPHAQVLAITQRQLMVTLWTYFNLILALKQVHSGIQPNRSELLVLHSKGQYRQQAVTAGKKANQRISYAPELSQCPITYNDNDNGLCIEVDRKQSIAFIYLKQKQALQASEAKNIITNIADNSKSEQASQINSYHLVKFDLLHSASVSIPLVLTKNRVMKAVLTAQTQIICFNLLYVKQF